jgi:hypothetical protein
MAAAHWTMWNRGGSRPERRLHGACSDSSADRRGTRRGLWSPLRALVADADPLETWPQDLARAAMGKQVRGLPRREGKEG